MKNSKLFFGNCILKTIQIQFQLFGLLCVIWWKLCAVLKRKQSFYSYNALVLTTVYFLDEMPKYIRHKELQMRDNKKEKHKVLE